MSLSGVERAAASPLTLQALAVARDTSRRHHHAWLEAERDRIQLAADAVAEGHSTAIVAKASGLTKHQVDHELDVRARMARHLFKKNHQAALDAAAEL